MNIPHRIALLVAPVFVLAFAPGTRSMAQTVLRITTDPPGAAVYVDSAAAGRSPVDVRLSDPINPGKPGRSAATVVTIVGGTGKEWFAPVVTDTLRPETSRTLTGVGDTLSLHYVLPLSARIASDPPGAGVLLGDSLIGSTPLFASLPRTVSTLRLRMAGYRDEQVLIDPGTFNYRVALVPLDSGAAPRPLAGVNGEGSTKLLVAAGIAVVSGTTSALLKHKADESYDDYLATGDPATLGRVRRLDVSSALSLAVAQLAIGYLVIELLSR